MKNLWGKIKSKWKAFLKSVDEIVNEIDGGWD